MERFNGNLDSYRLQLLVPAILKNPAPFATLRLRRGSQERCFFFEEHFLIGNSSSNPKEHFTQLLSDLRIMDMPHAAAAFHAAHSQGTLLGTYLAEGSFIELARIVEALSHKSREAFFDCYLWETGEIEYIPEVGPPTKGLKLRLALGALHRDALARLQEWKAFHRVFVDFHSTLVVYPQGNAALDHEGSKLMNLAMKGATISELLSASSEGTLSAARRIMLFYRRGLIAPRSSAGQRKGPAEPKNLLAMAKLFLQRRQYGDALAVASRAIDDAPSPEVHALYREIEVTLALQISDELFALEGKLEFRPIPETPPETITTDDIYLWSSLKSARSLRQAVRAAPMGELQAYHSVKRLISAGLIVPREEPVRSPHPSPPAASSSIKRGGRRLN